MSSLSHDFAIHFMHLDILSKTVTSHGESSAGSTSVSTSLKEGNVDDNNKNSETTEGTSALELDKKIENFLQQYLSRPSLLLPVSLSEITFELNKVPQFTYQDILLSIVRSNLSMSLNINTFYHSDINKEWF